jgi:hypothetical protein
MKPGLASIALAIALGSTSSILATSAQPGIVCA